METADQLLERLDRTGIKRGEIAEVMGISSSNATRLYQPAANGLKRQLRWDEGVALCRAFGDRIGEKHTTIPFDRPELAIRIFFRRILTGDRMSPEEAADRFRRYLAIVTDKPAIHDSRDALEAVVEALFV